MDSAARQAELNKLSHRQQHLHKGKVMAVWMIVILLIGVAWAIRELMALRANGDWAIVLFSLYLVAAIGAFIYARQELRTINEQIRQMRDDKEQHNEALHTPTKP